MNYGALQFLPHRKLYTCSRIILSMHNSITTHTHTFWAKMMTIHQTLHIIHSNIRISPHDTKAFLICATNSCYQDFLDTNRCKTSTTIRMISLWPYSVTPIISCTDQFTVINSLWQLKMSSAKWQPFCFRPQCVQQTMLEAHKSSTSWFLCYWPALFVLAWR